MIVVCRCFMRFGWFKVIDLLWIVLYNFWCSFNILLLVLSNFCSWVCLFVVWVGFNVSFLRIMLRELDVIRDKKLFFFLRLVCRFFCKKLCILVINLFVCGMFIDVSVFVFFINVMGLGIIRFM